MLRGFGKLILWFLAVSVALWGAANPIIGTWKLNPEKSKDSAHHIPTSLIYTWATQEGGMINLTRDEISDKGQNRHSEWLGKFDGQDWPDTGSDVSDVGTIAVKQTGDRTFEFTAKKQGNVVATQKSVISDDGKTLTNVNNSRDEKGQLRSYTAVFDRQ
jgi:hypothetical protein